MKYYDYNKAIQLINENKDTIKSASLGMHEDWFWTAEPVWTDGAFIKELYAGDIMKEEANYKAAREKGLSVFSEEYDHIKIAGICSSDWATPPLHLEFKDGSDKMIPCYIQKGQAIPFPDNILIVAEKQSQLFGCLSGPAQDRITPLENE